LTITEFGPDGLNERADELIDHLRGVTRPRVFVISGPSGVGKDSVIESMRARLPELHYAVTATTRTRRPGEIDGVHYIFMTQEAFATELKRGEFLEHATVYGNFYGVPKGRLRDALRAGKSVVVKVDVQGARTIRSLHPHAVLIYIAPPNMSELLQRLRGRKTDDFHDLMKRLSTATHELTAANEFDYIVFNESERISEAVEQIATIVAAERLRILQDDVTL
jgi:guanylate kinase